MTGSFVLFAAGLLLGTSMAGAVGAWRLRRLKAHEQHLTLALEERTADLEERSAQLQVANDLLQHLATVDDLTNLANTRSFKVALATEWQRARRTRSPLSLLMLDVDRFKPFNDTLGHQRGDECLVQVAAVLREAASRATDLAARYGGEEFALLLPNTPADGARRVAETVRAGVEALRIPHPWSEAGPFVTVSVGVATVDPAPGETAEEFIRSADRALYSAKHAGRNRIASDADLTAV